MTRVSKITMSLREKNSLVDVCTHPVHVTEVNTLTRRIRFREAARRGLDPTSCNNRSMYLVDGCPRCLNHAGQDAIKILTGEKE